MMRIKPMTDADRDDDADEDQLAEHGRGRRSSWPGLESRRPS